MNSSNNESFPFFRRSAITLSLFVGAFASIGNVWAGDLNDLLPVMPDNERVILVETRNVYAPRWDIGMADQNLENFVFTRPRFAPQLVFSNS